MRCMGMGLAINQSGSLTLSAIETSIVTVCWPLIFPSLSVAASLYAFSLLTAPREFLEASMFWDRCMVSSAKVLRLQDAAFGVSIGPPKVTLELHECVTEAIQTPSKPTLWASDLQHATASPMKQPAGAGDSTSTSSSALLEKLQQCSAEC